jgi:hypothetical protein
MFSRKQWLDMRFCEREILASPDLRITQLGRGRCVSRRVIVARTSRQRTIRLDRRARTCTRAKTGRHAR